VGAIPATWEDALCGTEEYLARRRAIGIAK